MNERIRNFFMALRPPLLLLGVFASFSLYSWHGSVVSTRCLLVVCSVALVNSGYNLVNEYRDREDDLEKHGGVPVQELSDKFIVGVITLFLVSGSIFSLFLIRYDIIYLVFVCGALLGGYVYNVGRRKDLLGNACLDLAYTCAALMALYPEHLIFGLGFGLFTIGHNIGVQVEDFEYDTVRTVPKQFNRFNAAVISGVVGVLSLLMFLLTPVRYFALSPLIVSLGSFGYIFMGNHNVFQDYS